MKKIFKDFEIIKLEKDPEAAGVFLKAKKPKNYTRPVDLSEISLYSIVLGKRTKEIVIKFPFQRKCKILIPKLVYLVKSKLNQVLILK
jgi:hypothetical protein